MTKGVMFEFRSSSSTATSSSTRTRDEKSHSYPPRRRRNPTATTATTQVEQEQEQEQKPQQRFPIEEFIPSYLRRFVYPYQGDFCVSRVYHPRLMAQLMAEGFLPIATPEVLLPKLHVERCVIDLQQLQQQQHPLHISKSTRKKSKRFLVTLNQAWDAVIAGCHEQHGDKCWLYPPLVQVLEAMYRVEHTPALILQDNRNDHRSNPQVCPVRLYSVEVWNVATGHLAGGELGYTVGSIYTSLTGFAREDSAGSVQLAALGRLLQARGFSLWDLGMEMDYKRTLGCQLMPRADFVRHVHQVRHAQGHMTLPCISLNEQCNAKDVINQTWTPPRNDDGPVTSVSPMAVDTTTTAAQQAPDPSRGRVHHASHKLDPHRTKRLKAVNGMEQEEDTNERVDEQGEEEKKSDDVVIQRMLRRSLC